MKRAKRVTPAQAEAAEARIRLAVKQGRAAEVMRIVVEQLGVADADELLWMINVVTVMHQRWAKGQSVRYELPGGTS